MMNKTASIIGLIVSMFGVGVCTVVGLQPNPVGWIGVAFFLWRITVYREDIPIFAHEYIVHDTEEEKTCLHQE